MAEYIKREDAVDAFERVVHHDAICKAVREEIDEIPAADVVEVVRCKDCARYANLWCEMLCRVTHEDFFCADGRRREDDV